MTSVWPIPWSYAGVDWPGYATGFAVVTMGLQNTSLFSAVKNLHFSNVCLFTVATLETLYNTWVIPASRLVESFSCCSSDHFQFLGFPFIDGVTQPLQGLGYSIDKWYEHCCLSPLIFGLSISRSHRLLRLLLFNSGQAAVNEACRVIIGMQLLLIFENSACFCSSFVTIVSA